MVKSSRNHPTDQMNVRIGSDFILRFNAYMEGREETKIQFIRDALDYWMSVDGKGDHLQEKLDQAEIVTALLEKRISDLEKYPERCLEYQNKIIEEKERIIRLLTKQLNKRYERDYHYGGRVEETIAGLEPEYLI